MHAVLDTPNGEGLELLLGGTEENLEELSE